MSKYQMKRNGQYVYPNHKLVEEINYLCEALKEDNTEEMHIFISIDIEDATSELIRRRDNNE